MVEVRIGANDAGQRLDRFMKKYFPGAGLSQVYKMIRKDVKVNGRRAKAESMMGEGDILTIYIDEQKADELRVRNGQGMHGAGSKAKRQFRICYEDDNMLAVSKPAGLLTHGDGKEKKNTLVNQVEAYLIEKGDYDPSGEQTFRPAAANRLDRNTSGLVLFGKNADQARRLAAMIREGEQIKKYYLAIVRGEIKSERLLDASLIKDAEKNTMHVAEAGDDNDDAKSAKTRIRPIATTRLKETGNGYFSLIEAELITGRTHQIRTHLAATGHPIIGDPKYGDVRINRYMKEKYGLVCQLLHAWKIEIEDDMIEAPVPKMFVRIKDELFQTVTK